MAYIHHLSTTREDRAMKHSVDILTNDRPVMALQDEYPAGFIDPMHSHDHTQILYASAGVLSVRTTAMSFVIPPQRAVWLPAGPRHELACPGPVSLRTRYLPVAGRVPSGAARRSQR